MWPPSKTHALPSMEEIQQIKKEITSVELEIIHTQLKLGASRNSITAQKARIAPMRQITHELMSQIFLEVNLGD